MALVVKSQFSRASLVAQLIKNPPVTQDIQVRFLIRKDLLGKEMAIQSRSLAWRIPWMEEPGRLQSMGSPELDMT